jgi:hypothetical protein
MNRPADKRKIDEARKGYQNYLRYSGLGLQMAGAVLVSVLLGRWLDGVIGWKFPLLTMAGALGGVAGAMIFLFKETGRRK